MYTVYAVMCGRLHARTQLMLPTVLNLEDLSGGALVEGRDRGKRDGKVEQ